MLREVSEIFFFSSFIINLELRKLDFFFII